MELGRAHAILERSLSAFISMDAAGDIVDWNPAAELLFGIKREDAVGRELAETVIPARLRELHREGLRRFLETGQDRVLDRRLELAAIRGDGAEFPVEITLSARAENDGWSFHAFVQDISARHAADIERSSLVAQLEAALHGSEQRLHAIVEVLAESVTIRDLDGRIIYANPAALTQLGFASLEQLRAAAPRSIMSEYVVRGQDGRPLSMDDIPSIKLLRGEPVEPLLIQTVSKRDGEESWRLLKAAGLRNGDGEPEAAITIIEDVTAPKRAELRLRFLVRMSEILASSLDYSQTLANVARLGFPSSRTGVRSICSTRTGGASPWPSPMRTPGSSLWPSSCGPTTPPQRTPDAALAQYSPPARASCSRKSPTSCSSRPRAIPSTCDCCARLE